MEFTLSNIFFADHFPSSFAPLAATLFCLFFAAVLTIRKGKLLPGSPESRDYRGFARAIEGSGIGGGDVMMGLLNGIENGNSAVERLTGASMMEQLVPEITTHALSYLDYPSLCRLSMTNSHMREAANDDNAWKALYRKDFTSEQDNVTPPRGWKAYYAATRTILNTNAEFFRIIKERSLPAMARFWLNSDYVKFFHANGDSFNGYDAVMECWQLAFSWDNVADVQIRDVRTRVLTDMAWVTMNAYIDMETDPFNITNIFEFHNGRWFMVHHHTSTLMHAGGWQLLPHG